MEHDYPFEPSYENVCWNCGGPINNLSCLNAGFDETGSNGYECPRCGKHLGHQRNPQDHEDFEITNSHCL